LATDECRYSPLGDPWTPEPLSTPLQAGTWSLVAHGRAQLDSETDRGLAVGLAAVTYAHHPDFARSVVYLVDNAVIANPDAPVAVRTGELAATVRAWIDGQRPKRARHSSEDRDVKTP
jgi:hypothetical protein